MPVPQTIQLERRVERLNRYRERLNPVRGLTLQRAVTLLESYPRGEFADYMWALGAPMVGIEAADPDLSAILTRRCATLAEMDQQATPAAGDDVDEFLAAEQAAAIEQLVGRLDNLYEIVDHLQLALNRGFAHVEIQHDAAGDPYRLAPVDQWNIVRDGMHGGWKYNPKALQTTYDSLPDAYRLDPGRFLVREVARPLGRIGLVKFIRSNLSEKDWDAFVEIYGMPTGVVVMPADVPPERETEYQTVAGQIAEGGSGALPHGSEYHANPAIGDKGTDIYDTRLRHLSEKLVLAGTGGKLTMLAESGSGTLAGSAHQDAFEQLGRADARAVSELIQRQLIAPWLRRQFPGRPIQAEWALAFREEVDASQIIDDVAKLSAAGYRVDPAEIAGKTGYTLTLAPDPQASPDQSSPDNPLRGLANRFSPPRPSDDTPESETRSKSLSAPRVDIRQTPKFASRVANTLRRWVPILRNRAETGDDDDLEPADPDDARALAAALAQAGRGSLAAWEEILATALAEGATGRATDDIEA